VTLSSTCQTFKPSHSFGDTKQSESREESVLLPRSPNSSHKHQNHVKISQFRKKSSRHHCIREKQPESKSELIHSENGESRVRGPGWLARRRSQSTSDEMPQSQSLRLQAVRIKEMRMSFHAALPHPSQIKITPGRPNFGVKLQ